MKKIFTLFCAAIMALGLNAATRQFDGKIAQDAKPELKLNLLRTPMHHDASRKAANVALENVNFTMSVADTTATTAEVTITPNSETTQYLFSCIPLAAYDTLTETDIAAAFQEQLDEAIAYYGMLGLDLTYADFAISDVSKDTLDGLDPATEYVLFAYVLDTTTGLASSAFDTVHFTTQAIEMSDNQISMTYSNDTLYITTTNADPYFFYLESSEEFEMYYGEDRTEATLKSEIKYWASKYEDYLGYLLFSGDTALIMSDYYYMFNEEEIAEGDYIALAAPYSITVNGTSVYNEFTYVEPTIVCTDTINVHITSPEWTNNVATYGWWQVMGAESADTTIFVSLSNSDTESVPGTYAKEDMDMDYSYIYLSATGTAVYFSTLTVTIVEQEGYYIISAEGAAKNKVYYRLTFDPIQIGGTGIEEIAAPMINNAKMLINGNVVIRHDDHLYNLQGAQLK